MVLVASDSTTSSERPASSSDSKELERLGHVALVLHPDALERGIEERFRRALDPLVHFDGVGDRAEDTKPILSSAGEHESGAASEVGPRRQKLGERRASRHEAGELVLALRHLAVDGLELTANGLDLPLESFLVSREAFPFFALPLELAAGFVHRGLETPALRLDLFELLVELDELGGDFVAIRENTLEEVVERGDLADPVHDLAATALDTRLDLGERERRFFQPPLLTLNVRHPPFELARKLFFFALPRLEPF